MWHSNEIAITLDKDAQSNAIVIVICINFFVSFRNHNRNFFVFSVYFRFVFVLLTIDIERYQSDGYVNKLYFVVPNELSGV